MQAMTVSQLQSTAFDVDGKGPSLSVCAPLRKRVTFEDEQPCEQPATESTLDALPSMDGDDWDTESEASSDDSYDNEDLSDSNDSMDDKSATFEPPILTPSPFFVPPTKLSAVPRELTTPDTRTTHSGFIYASGSEAREGNCKPLIDSTQSPIPGKCGCPLKVFMTGMESEQLPLSLDKPCKKRVPDWGFDQKELPPNLPLPWTLVVPDWSL